MPGACIERALSCTECALSVHVACTECARSVHRACTECAWTHKYTNTKTQIHIYKNPIGVVGGGVVGAVLSIFYVLI